jgi:hypothetical protein
VEGDVEAGIGDEGFHGEAGTPWWH